MIARYLAALSFLACLLPLANAAESVTVKELLMQALNSPDGTAKGIVEGREADAIHTATGTSDPVSGEVSTIKRFRQEGCSRLNLRLIQPNTPTREGSKTDFALQFELNLCRNGMPPNDAITTSNHR